MNPNQYSQQGNPYSQQQYANQGYYQGYGAPPVATSTSNVPQTGNVPLGPPPTSMGTQQVYNTPLATMNTLQQSLPSVPTTSQPGNPYAASGYNYPNTTPAYGGIPSATASSLPPMVPPISNIPPNTATGVASTNPAFQPAALTSIQSMSHGNTPSWGQPQTQNYQPVATSTTPRGTATAAATGRSPQRINPAQVPSPVSIDNKSIIKFTTHNDGNAPPPASTQFVANDEGNCNPRFMRMTSYTIPTTHELQSSSGIPLGVIVQPLAEVQTGEYPVAVVDFGTSGPLRCQRCRAYMNPFNKFVAGGKEFICKICDFSNEVSNNYFAPLAEYGRRSDILNRPELLRGSVEYVATAEYIERPPVPPMWLFAIDVSYTSLASGMLHAAINSIITILSSQPSESQTRVGFLTYDTTVHFYNLNPSLQHAQMLVIPDLAEVFPPVAQEVIFVKYAESKTIIDELLQKLPTMFQHTKINESALGAAVQAGELALKNIGGKVIAFQSCLASIGPGKLKKRDDQKVLGTDKEKHLYQPQEAFYTTLGLECWKSKVSVDLFLFPNGYLDVSTLGTMTRITGGQIYLYQHFNYHKDSTRFHQDLSRNLTRTYGYDGVIRMRTSRGLTVTQQIGNFHLVNGDEMHVAGIDADKSFVVHLKHEEKLDEKFEPIIQCAMLYTTSNGERRVRVHTLALTCSSTLANVFRSADSDAILNLVTRTALKEVVNNSMGNIRNQLIDTTINMLAMYRKYCASPSSSGQLILPEALKFMPMYILSLIKSTLMRTGTDVNIDERSYLLELFHGCVSPALSTVFAYPRFYALHQIPSECGVVDQEGQVKLPPLVRLSSEFMSPDGAYLLEDGQHMFLWLGRELSPSFIANVFGVDAPSVDALNCSEISVGVHENEESSRINAIINTIRKHRNYFPSIQIVKARDPLEPVFLSYLYEDKGHDAIAMSYVDFLCHAHKLIQNKLND